MNEPGYYYSTIYSTTRSHQLRNSTKGKEPNGTTRVGRSGAELGELVGLYTPPTEGCQPGNALWEVSKRFRKVEIFLKGLHEILFFARWGVAVFILIVRPVVLFFDWSLGGRTIRDRHS
jgi:hypothetical protein